jgi:hypothetical protein
MADFDRSFEHHQALDVITAEHPPVAFCSLGHYRPVPLLPNTYSVLRETGML